MSQQSMIDRYTAGERIIPWVTAIAFVLLAASGLALFHPSVFWLTGLLGGGTWARVLHPFHIGRGSGDIRLRTIEWPVPRPEAWREWVERPQTDAEVEAIRMAVRRGVPYGSDPWREMIAAKAGRSWSLRPRGRPRK